jgi:hypothetical protein
MKSESMNSPRPLSLRSLVFTAGLALAASSALAFSRPADILIDGQKVTSDVPPVTTIHQAFLPLRAVTAGIGAQLSYNAKTRTVLVVHGTDRLKLRVGQHTATLNGRQIELSHAPFTVRGRTMVATRTVERALGPKVRYNPRKSTIDVYTTDTSVAADQDDSSSSDAF